MSKRAEQRRIKRETLRQLQYLKSGFDLIAGPSWQSNGGRSKYVPHIGKKRGGSGPVFAEWYKEHLKIIEEFMYNSDPAREEVASSSLS